MNGTALAPVARTARARAWPTWLKRAGSVLPTALLGLALLLAVIVAAGAALGYRGEVILTGSMRPHFQPGDMVIVHRIPATQIRVGEIISFSAPDRGNITITHRVRSVRQLADGRIAVETRGDANNVSEHWSISDSGSVGEVIAHLPKFGYVTHWMAGFTARIILFAVLGLALLGVGLRWAWRP